MPGRWGQYGEIFRAVCSNFLLIVPIGIALPGAAAGEEEGNETHDSKCQRGEEEDHGHHVPGVAAGCVIGRRLRGGRVLLCGRWCVRLSRFRIGDVHGGIDAAEGIGGAAAQIHSQDAGLIDNYRDREDTGVCAQLELHSSPACPELQDQLVGLLRDLRRIGVGKVRYTSVEYTRGCMHKRNRHLVDHSGVCVAYLTESRGGTAYTVDYARKNGVPVINLGEK